MIDMRCSVLSPPEPPLDAATPPMATTPSVQHQKTFCQIGILLPARPDEPMTSSVYEPESDEVMK